MNTIYDQYGRPLNEEPELYEYPTPNALSLAAMICGILSIPLVCLGGAFIPAALGLLFALLSRKTRMCGQAKVGLVTSIVSLSIYVLALLASVVTLSLMGVLGPLTEKALSTDFTDPASVEQFQEELGTLLDEKLGRLDEASRRLLGGYNAEGNPEGNPQGSRTGSLAGNTAGSLVDSPTGNLAESP